MVPIAIGIGKVSGSLKKGELAQLVERLHGMQEVSGSTPLFSTLKRFQETEAFCHFEHISW